MAYDASGNTGQPQQVAGSTPLGGSQGPSQPQNQVQPTGTGPSGGSTVQASNTGSQAQPGGTSKPKSGRASSGMFTNIQKYVQANKPQAQNMATAATQTVTDKAQNIGQSVQQKKDQLSGRIQANMNRLNEQRNFAQQQIQQTAQGQEIQQPDVDRFQSLLVEGPEVQQVRNLDVSRGEARAQALQNLTNRVGTDAGRRQLLQDTFGGREYNRGQSSLDSLIMSSDRAAREGLVEDTRAASQGLQDQIELAKRASELERQGLIDSAENFVNEVNAMGDEAFTGIGSELDERIAAERALIAERLGGLEEGAQAEYADFFRRYGQTPNITSELANRVRSGGFMLGSGADWQGFEMNVAAALDSLSRQGRDISQLTAQDLQDELKRSGGARNLSQGRLGDYVGQTFTNTWGRPQERETYDLSSGRFTGIDNFRRSGAELADVLRDADLGLDIKDISQAQLAGDNITDRLRGTYSTIQDYDIGGVGQYLQDQAAAVAAARENLLERVIENQYDTDFDEFQAGEFLDRTGVAEQRDVDRIAALRNLLKRQTDDVGVEEEGLGADAQMLENLYGRFLG